MTSMKDELLSLKFKTNARLNTIWTHRIVGRRNAAKNGNRWAVVNRNTEITIDGIQRSGNTFFTDVFRGANPEARLVHHMHSSGQLARSMDLNKPTVVLVREPLSCVATMHALWPYIDLESGLKVYAMYYERILKRLTHDEKKAAVGVFDEVIRDPDSLIRRVNQQFNRSFLTAADVKVNWRELFEANDPRREARKLAGDAFG